MLYLVLYIMVNAIRFAAISLIVVLGLLWARWWTLRCVPHYIPMNMTLYRQGQFVPFRTLHDVHHCVSTPSIWLETASLHFPSRRTPVTRVIPHPYNETLLLALADGEHFVWPFLGFNHTTEVPFVIEDIHDMEVSRHIQQQPLVRALSESPRIFLVEHLLTDDECDALIAAGRRQVVIPSRVAEAQVNHVNRRVRLSEQAWVNLTTAATHDRILERVDRRLQALTQLPSDLSEPLQVVFYNTSTGFYHAHHDYGLAEQLPTNTYLKAGGNRFVTLLLYLNTVDQGGETVFPYVAAHDGWPQLRHVPSGAIVQRDVCQMDCLKIKPVKGNAVLFYNLEEHGHADGVVDEWSLHAGCPPLSGPKIVANRWQRNKRVQGRLFGENF